MEDYKLVAFRTIHQTKTGDARFVVRPTKDLKLIELSFVEGGKVVVIEPDAAEIIAEALYAAAAEAKAV